MADVEVESPPFSAAAHGRASAYLVFEGGGAKGLVHVGALRAIEEAGIDILGVSGTSAGAIMAALVAAGYRADELFAPDGSRTILTELGFTRATQLFGAGGWFRIRIFRALLSGFPRMVVIGGAGALAGLSIRAFADVTAGWPVPWVALTAVALVAGALVLGGMLLRRLAAGLASTDEFAVALNRALASKVGPGADGKVRFTDLPLPLKVVATRLDDRQLSLFSRERTPDEVVADAVAASIAIPVVFTPKLLQVRRPQSTTGGRVPHYDGGLVSNLPAWGWDEERALHPDDITIAVEIEPGKTEDRSPTGALLKPFENIASAVMAGIFGAGNLNKRAAGRLVSLITPTRLKVLDFDMTRQDAREAVDNAYKTAIGHLIHELDDKPRLLNGTCQDIVDEVMRELASYEDAPTFVRAYLAVHDPDFHHCLRIRYGFSTADDLHDEMIASLHANMLQEAWKDGTAAFLAPPEATIENRWRRTPSMDGVTWLIAVPIYKTIADSENGHPDMVLIMDGDGNKDYADERFDVLSTQAARTFQAVLDRLDDLRFQRRTE